MNSRLTKEGVKSPRFTIELSRRSHWQWEVVDAKGPTVARCMSAGNAERIAKVMNDADEARAARA